MKSSNNYDQCKSTSATLAHIDVIMAASVELKELKFESSDHGFARKISDLL